VDQVLAIDGEVIGAHLAPNRQDAFFGHITYIAAESAAPSGADRQIGGGTFSLPPHQPQLRHTHPVIARNGVSARS
jgi:hypothetical protein